MAFIQRIFPISGDSLLRKRKKKSEHDAPSKFFILSHIVEKQRFTIIFKMAHMKKKKGKNSQSTDFQYGDQTCQNLRTEYSFKTKNTKKFSFITTKHCNSKSIDKIITKKNLVQFFVR